MICTSLRIEAPIITILFLERFLKLRQKCLIIDNLVLALIEELDWHCLGVTLIKAASCLALLNWDDLLHNFFKCETLVLKTQPIPASMIDYF